MQSSSYTLSHSILLPRKPSIHTSPYRFNPISTPSSSKSPNFVSINGLSLSSSRRFSSVTCSSSSSSSFSSRLNGGWISSPSLVPQRQSDGFEVRAASVPESADESDKSKKAFSETLVLGSLFGLWYLFNIYFNIYNKQVLKVFPYPVTITVAQFAVGTVLVTLMWSLNLYKRPKISTSQLVAILPLAVVHVLGNVFTNMSLGKVAVSFTHTIKAMEPFSQLSSLPCF